MNNLFSKSPERLSKNNSDTEFVTLCDWLRSISQQNKQIMNLLKVINLRELDSAQTYFKDDEVQEV